MDQSSKRRIKILDWNVFRRAVGDKIEKGAEGPLRVAFTAGPPTHNRLSRGPLGRGDELVSTCSHVGSVCRRRAYLVEYEQTDR